MSLTESRPVCEAQTARREGRQDRLPQRLQPGCEWCERHPDRSCPACAARRRRAVRLVSSGGLSMSEAAREMRVSLARVERLLEADADRRCISEFAGRGEHGAAAQLLVDRRRREPA